MIMVEFLKELKGEDFTYEKGKRYRTMTESVDELKGKISVRQPDSTKKGIWWTTFPMDAIGKIFNIVDDNEMYREEVNREYKQLQDQEMSLDELCDYGINLLNKLKERDM